jgi:hypothetical protein
LTYESERWFSPRLNAEMNTSAPPRRSIFTPSRLSARRIRESTKPYWRCPKATSSFTSSKNTSVRNNLAFMDNAAVGDDVSILDKDVFLNDDVLLDNITVSGNAKSVDNATSVDNAISVDNNAAVGISAAVDDNAKSQDNVDKPSVDNSETIKEIITNNSSNEITTGVIHPTFTFAESVVRDPKFPEPLSKPKAIYQDKDVQTDPVQPVKVIEKIQADKPIEKQPEPSIHQNSTSAPVVGGFQFNSVPQNGGIIQFGTSNSEAPTDSLMSIDSNGYSGMAKNIFSETAACAPVSGYQFTSEPLTGGVFQFGSGTSNVTNDSTFCGGTTRNGVAARKIIHAKRMKKR